MRKVIVKKNHKSTDPDSLTANTGDTLKGEEKPTIYPNWIWCQNAKGVSSWVPKSYLKPIKTKPGYYKVLKDYVAKELTVKAGDEVIIIFEDSDWAWTRTKEGEEGWIPLDNLDL